MKCKQCLVQVFYNAYLNFFLLKSCLIKSHSPAFSMSVSTIIGNSRSWQTLQHSHQISNYYYLKHGKNVLVKLKHLKKGRASSARGQGEVCAVLALYTLRHNLSNKSNRHSFARGLHSQAMQIIRDILCTWTTPFLLIHKDAANSNLSSPVPYPVIF